MTDPNWQFLSDVNVLAKPKSGYWTLALDYVGVSKRLRLIVEETVSGVPNKWNYAPEKVCTADGDPAAPINPANCIVVDAPPGALIAKVGGSTAGKNDGGHTFVVGSYCVIELDDKTKGPLYLTMNTDPTSLLERSGKLFVKIYHSA